MEHLDPQEQPGERDAGVVHRGDTPDGLQEPQGCDDEPQRQDDLQHDAGTGSADVGEGVPGRSKDERHRGDREGHRALLR